MLLDKSSSFDKQFMVCISVDGDDCFPGGIKKGFPILIKLLDKHKLAGRITWFINEYRYKWTENYPDYLRQLVLRDEDIQLHSHLEKEIVSNDEKKIYYKISAGKFQLESFIKSILKKPYKITCFRSGSLVKSELLYKTLEKLDFKCDSSFLPGVSSFYKKYNCELGNPELPLQQREFFIDSSNLKNLVKKENKVLELPVSNVLLHPRELIPFSNGNILFYSLYFHPYNLVKRNGKKNLFAYLYYDFIFYLLKKVPTVKFLTVKEAEKICRKQLM